ncbi:uncharacterized protein Z519_01717 [Cladophialophora bantiana CBS 173.52]|uniref:MHYT domain-containing protein n=1 Tax=Cladophialophora bantiana (strain ATCC 10958 / CBS 173.52 / CDC B-1940 / NIH 8579) TaxID=1442370 RepID=A0A0D2HXK7_CLAB1|nr:uncharacterized protein Z519_01717 [Cladophialophora bantiana CBS 173.52]KIW98133.1 hypothetical protein Z519_01717 [Cladophialophora bantiana CBS 173.52]
MGGIGIWGMHFVGNRAIVLQDGDPERQILYDPGFTVISFFMPILVLLFAFYTLGMPTRARQLHVAIAACLTGAAVCGMHYLGQYSVENYVCFYRAQNVAGAAIIAVLTSFIALGIFFRLRDAWKDGWWKRALCGVILATAVSGMHWTAAVGTIYHWKGHLSIPGNSRSQTAVIAAALSMGSCVILLAVAFIRGRNKLTARIKAQRLMLACAYFDDEGRVMVTQEGTLPSEKITNHYIEKTFGEDELSRSHPTYLWIFQASRNWITLRDLIPSMKEYIENDPTARKFRPSNISQNLPHDAMASSLNFAPIFKQLFCVAAQQLANHIHEPLERLGVLFEEHLDTGATSASTPLRIDIRLLSARSYKKTADAEKGFLSPLTVSRGKYFFVHRQINKGEAARFAALGYRFATIEQIAEPLTKSMQVDRDNMVAKIERMKLGASSGHLLPPGVHLACFMLRPSMYKSFDILVPAASQDHLPHVTVQSGDLSKDQLAQLNRFEDCTVSEILRILLNQSSESQIGDEIRWQLYNTFVKLVDVIGDYDTMMQAKFSAKAFRVASRPGDGPSPSPTCTLLTVRVLRSIHATSSKKELTYVPLSFFSAQQQSQAKDCRDELFEQKVKAEFRRPAHGDFVQNSSSISVNGGRRTSSVDSARQGPEPPSSAPITSTLAGFPTLTRPRSDDATVIERDKSIAEGSDVEMMGITMPDSAHLGNETGTTHADVPEPRQAGNGRNSWVSEVFGLFRPGAEGWSNARGGGWKQDINVENSFEIRRKGSSIEHD